MGRRELAQFLRDRRAALDPAALGLPTTPRRRTPGLRREEVADRAAISVDYYVRIEQARGPHPSTRILESVSAALELTDAERRHLFQLAGAAAPVGAAVSRQVHPRIEHMLYRMSDTAALVTNAAYDVVAFNPLAEHLIGGLREQPNLARRRFLYNMHWSSAADEFAEVAVARLRAAADRYRCDAYLTALIDELRVGSDEFVSIWDTNPVRAAGHRTKTTDHPDLGTLHLNCDVLTVPDDDQQVVLITATPGSPTAQALRHLATRT